MVKILKVSTGRTVPIAPDRGRTICLVDESLGAHQVDVHINVLRPGGPEGPYHHHERTENVYWVLSGRGRMIAEGQEHVLDPDHVVFIPPGTRHSLTNIGTEDLRVLEIYAPAGKDSVRD